MSGGYSLENLESRNSPEAVGGTSRQDVKGPANVFGPAKGSQRPAIVHIFSGSR
jgi:hypothetical protein